MPTRNVAIFTRLYPPAYKGGGPIRTLEALVGKTRDPYVPWVIAADRDLGDTARLRVPRNRWVRRGSAQVHFTSADSLKEYLSVLLKIRKIRPSIIYVNSFFSIKFSTIPQVLSLVKFFGPARVLLAPRGEMGRGALGLKSIKKRCFIRLYRGLGLHRGVYWHASNPNEANDIRKVFGESATVVLKEDDTQLPVVAELPRVPKGPVRFVFVSRIVPIKGLDILLEALQQYDNPSVRISLDIYGMEEDKGFVEKCRKIAARVPKTVHINWKGILPEDRVRPVMAKYDYFVLPTKGENFGHIIAEALSVSVPVICPDTTLWTSILEAGGGHVVPANEPHIWKELLVQLAESSLEERAEAKDMAYCAYNRWVDNRDPESVFNKLEKIVEDSR